MPHLTEARKAELRQTPTAAKGPGDWNFVYFDSYCRVWSKKDKQSYATVHSIRRDSVIPSTNEEIIEAEANLVLLKVDNQDRKVAREEAYDEFRRLVVVPYEDKKIAENGSAAEGVPYAINPAPVQSVLSSEAKAKLEEAVKVVKGEKK
jgi:hypothetical protein